MASLIIEGGTLRVRMTRLERFGSACFGDRRVPLSSVRSARVSTTPWSELKGIRVLGTGFPQILALGTRRYRGGKDFVAVHGNRPAVVVELVGAPYRRLVVTVKDAQAIADSLNAPAEQPTF